MSDSHDNGQNPVDSESATGNPGRTDPRQSPPEGTESATGIWAYLPTQPGRIVFLAATLILLGIVFLSFHTILLPFIFACVIVYLMEPIVRRMGRWVPRWLAVVVVYIGFFGVVTVSVVLIAPRFVSEIERFTQTVPQKIKEFRRQKLPGLNAKAQSLLQTYLLVGQKDANGELVHRKVARAALRAGRVARSLGQARQRVHNAASTTFHRIEIVSKERTEKTTTVNKPEPIPVDDNSDNFQGLWRTVEHEPEPLAEIKRRDKRSYGVYLRPDSVSLKRVDKKRWVLEQADRVNSKSNAASGLQVRSLFDLEQALNAAIKRIASTSNKSLGAVLKYVQHLVFGILEVFLLTALTLMVAAFISIDLSRFLGFFRSLVPEVYRGGYDELLTRMDRGLAGVVRGQLLICVVNGILTYIGLFIFDIRFAVLLSVVAGVLSLIPIFGTIISTIPIVLIGLMDGFLTGVFILAWILAIHFFEANFLNPQIIGISAQIHPVIVIFALLAGESAFGLVGAILAVPTASILLTVFKFIRDKVFEESDKTDNLVDSY